MTRKPDPGESGVAGAIVLVALTLFVCTTAAAQEMNIRLTDVAHEANVTLLNICGGETKDYIVEVNGNGVAALDYDGDGDMDLFLANGSTLAGYKNGGDPLGVFYRNDGAGLFEDVTGSTADVGRGWAMGACVADYDNDGFKDLYLTAYGPDVMLRNNGDGTFTVVTEQSGLGNPLWGTNCAFGDYDLDGNVDLYVANYLTFDEATVPRRGASDDCRFRGVDVICGPRGLPGEPDTLYRNTGKGSFVETTQTAGINDPGNYGFGVIFSDLDNDGWPDIYVANDSGPNFLFKNDGDGSFVESALFSGAALSEGGREQAGMGVAASDYNADGYLDVFVTNFSHDSNTLYENSNGMLFADVTARANLGHSSVAYLGWGASFADLDNDGWVDLFVANGHVHPEVDTFESGTVFRQRNQLYRNMGDGRLREVTDQVGGGLLIEQSSRGAAVADIDNDGDLEIVITNLNERPTLLRNDGGNGAGHSLKIRLVGTESSRDAVGARVTLQVGERVQVAEVQSGGSYLSHNDPRLHFGLGSESKVDRLEIRWPGGSRQIFEDLPANRSLVIKEQQGIRAFEEIG